MKKINLLHENGNVFPVHIVRYFRFKNNIYLIYTLEEKDERDYMKLYVVKVMTELNEKVSQTVRRIEEWKHMKGIVKTILSQIKKGYLNCIKDYDPNELEGMIVHESKSFYIASDLVELLSITPEKLGSAPIVTNIVEQERNQDIVEDPIEILNIEEGNIPEEIEILELDDSEEINNEYQEIEVLEL